MNDSIPQKQCSTCPNSYPATTEFFSRDRTKKDGFRTTCKVCEKARKKAYHDTHKELLAEQRKRDHEKHKERIATYHKQWQQSERGKIYRKEYYRNHTERIHQLQNQVYQSDREQRIARQSRYRRTEQGRAVEKAQKWRRKAQKRATSGSYTAQQLQEQLTRQKRTCYYCKAKLETWHVDHVIPLARGGTNDISNIVIACPTCNMHKAAKLPHEWPEGGRLL